MSPDLRDDVYIPVCVDAAREIDGTEMFRATYLVVTSEAPGAVWEIDVPPIARLEGLGALGMLGVVFSALRGSEGPGADPTGFDIFADPQDVGSIFALEDEGALSIQLEDIWLPTAWCEGVPDWGDTSPEREEIERGDFFRVGQEIFQRAYRYGAGEISVDELLEVDPAGAVFRSPRETAAFQYWAEEQIEKSRQAFEEAPENLKLRWE